MKHASFNCAQCGAYALTPISAYNRAQRNGMRLFCNRACAGLARRKDRSDADKKAAKRIYDQKYRADNLDVIKAKKRDYFKATYDPATAKIERRKRAHLHAEYCRSPEYRAYKQDYDRKRRAAEFGEFADSYELLSFIESEIKSRATRYEIYQANGTLNKSLKRRREYDKSFSS